MLRDNSRKEYCDIEIDASLWVQMVRSGNDGQITRKAGLTPIPTKSGFEIIPGQLASDSTMTR